MKLSLIFLPVFLCLAGLANADPITATYTTAGATTGTGPWELTSTDATFSILRLIPNEVFTFSQLTDVTLHYNMVLGGIGGGTPRLAVVTSLGQALIHFGPAGSFSDPTLGLGSTGNLMSLTDVGRYDLGGVGGSAYAVPIQITVQP